MHTPLMVLGAPGVERFAITGRDEWLDLRKQDVTASVAAALLDVHEFLSPFGLYAIKSGTLVEDPEESGPMRRGRLLEPVAIQALREDRPDWQVIAANDVYFRFPDLRIGGTPDAYAIDPARDGFGVVQVKSVEGSVFRRKWCDEEGTITPPLYAVVQAIVEARLTGASWAVVVALIVGFGIEVHVVEVPLHAGLWDRLVNEVANFWIAVENCRPPEPDMHKDERTIARMYAEDDGTEVDLSSDNELPDLLARREALKAAEADGNAAAKERKAIDAQILFRLRHAARGRLADGTLIIAPTVRRQGYVVNPSTYRSVKVKSAGVPRGGSF